VADNGAAVRSMMANISMPMLDIVRLESSLKWGTFGALKIAGELFAVTLERPWLDNRPMVSCVPPGQYHIKLTDTGHHGRCYMLQDVPGREAVLIHKGNFQSDSEGCILLGSKWCYLGSRRGVAESSITYDRFMTGMLNAPEGLLTIREIWRS
jgi:hypothetical protein